MLPTAGCPYTGPSVCGYLCVGLVVLVAYKSTESVGDTNTVVSVGREYPQVSGMAGIGRQTPIVRVSPGQRLKSRTDQSGLRIGREHYQADQVRARQCDASHTVGPTF